MMRTAPLQLHGPFSLLRFHVGHRLLPVWEDFGKPQAYRADVGFICTA